MECAASTPTKWQVSPLLRESKAARCLLWRAKSRIAERVSRTVELLLKLAKQGADERAVCGVGTDITTLKRADEMQARHARQAALGAGDPRHLLQEDPRWLAEHPADQCGVHGAEP